MGDTNRAWHLTGTGFEALRLQEIPVPRPGPREVVLRQECVTICFSSVKVIRLGAEHPRLTGRDLAVDPVILGDESVGTVVEAGEELRDRFRPGEVRLVQPDLGDGRAFGYGIPGGLVRYRIVSEGLLGQLLPVGAGAVEKYGFFSFPLAEPLACVERSCSIPFRPAPRQGGRRLCLSSPGAASVAWDFDEDTDVPGSVVLIDPAGAFADLKAALDASVVSDGPLSAREQFDDIVIAPGDGTDAGDLFTRASERLADGGTLAVVGAPGNDTDLPVDVGTVHYRGHIVVGGPGPGLSSCYRRRTGYAPEAGDTVLLLGAGGPMGQMFVLWLLGNRSAAPKRIVCTDVDDGRLEALRRLGRGAPAGMDFVVADARTTSPGEALAGDAIDYLVILCPALDAARECVPHLAEGAVINCFAGMKGATLPIGARELTSRALRVVGFSGLDTPAMQSALGKIASGGVDVAPIVAAVGGFDSGRQALEACASGAYPGKILIYNGVDAPLRPVAELTGGTTWSVDFERRFLAGELR